ncbi:hypothetical protein DFR86_01495 [Acidianus sulfidivorans JP7]|uniref:Uncharacterized protein n=1 Tax=Acidianus sulfidivorans JP7 TaxID=619593 RepID=A0A2U9IK09_9CREN|nr:hypothetical protein [Acidianus sulfidivorans]AWR96350.1 hypothetical protein DFR86_01495 [Acidianus sulfidivorans JP7]
MQWNFKNNKINSNNNYNNLVCSVDEIASSKSIQEIKAKYNISQQIIHKFVSEYIIKVHVEKKLSENEFLNKFELPREAKLELVTDIKQQLSKKENI